MVPSSLAMDFGPLQQSNKREILENILNSPLAEFLDPPLMAFTQINLNKLHHYLRMPKLRKMMSLKSVT